VRVAALLLAALLATATGAAGELELHGHAKLQGSLRLFDDDELGAAAAGSRVEDATFDLRLNTEWRSTHWDLTVDSQLLSVLGDSPGAAAEIGAEAAGLLGLAVPASDPHRWLDLEHTFSSTDSRLICGSFERLSVGFTGNHFVARLGRQALSWGGGLVFQVFDLFNPFAPTAIDTDYKPGTDMLSTQWLLDSGGDVQAIVVPRRPAPGQGLATDASSAALKWHQFTGALEVEFLGARHYDDTVVGAGASGNLAGGVWRVNGTYTRLTGGSGETSLVANFSRSWVWGERNTNAFVELFRSGFGVTDLDRDMTSLPAPLLDRLGRGELFSLGREELAAGIELEWTPLLVLEPTLLVNLDDRSSMLLLAMSYDWRQSLALDAGVQLGFGPRGTEYGGVPAGSLYASPGRLVWIRLSRYF